MSCGVGRRHGSDPALLWLWGRPEAVTLTWPLVWEPPYASNEALKTKKKQQQQQKKTPKIYLKKKKQRFIANKKTKKQKYNKTRKYIKVYKGLKKCIHDGKGPLLTKSSFVNPPKGPITHTVAISHMWPLSTGNRTGSNWDVLEV